ncbi:putative glycosyltransferase [Gaiella occulta]|uniref:Putative glycosyltransferase n=1 Tax=Gaiella occulta TaxID=1002870 RepID=A0A7M2Z252_9ACTN|nr:glycosyltransferase family 2 protein [Gaiella occulta]RDI76259.1 putative glycosyltransferase [Gaiella occulta]
MSCSIVIVSWNTREALAECLASVVADTATEVWVVDNASADGSADMVRGRYPSVNLLVNDRNRGFAAACNQALAQANGRLLLLLNPDARPQPGALRRLCAVLEERPEVGVVGGQLLARDGRPLRSYGAIPSVGAFLTEMVGLAGVPGLRRLLPAVAAAPRRRERPRSVGYTSGACLAFRRELLDTVGMLDERFFLYFEETDFCARVRQAGYLVWFEPAARVEHQGQASAARLGQEAEAHYARSAYAFIHKHRGARAARRLRAAFVVWLAAQLVLHRLGTLARRPGACAAHARKRRLLELHRGIDPHACGWSWTG